MEANASLFQARKFRRQTAPQFQAFLGHTGRRESLMGSVPQFPASQAQEDVFEIGGPLCESQSGTAA